MTTLWMLGSVLGFGERDVIVSCGQDKSRPSRAVTHIYVCPSFQ